MQMTYAWSPRDAADENYDSLVVHGRRSPALGMTRARSALAMFLLAHFPASPHFSHTATPLTQGVVGNFLSRDTTVASHRRGSRSGRARMAEGFEVKLRATDRVNQPVSPGNRSLDAYMKLPVAAYALMPMPPKSALRRQDGKLDQFILDMPPLTFAPAGPQFLAVEVQPRCYARVVSTPDAVHITSNSCILRGSDIINKLDLNKRFMFGLDTKFTWDERSITSVTNVRVDVNPPGPFALLPNGLMEKTGNTVMRFALDLIQTEFLKVLSQDFERWSRDDAYHEARAKQLQE